MEEQPPRTPSGRPDRERPVPLKRGGRPLPPRAPNTPQVDLPPVGRKIGQSRPAPRSGPDAKREGEAPSSPALVWLDKLLHVPAPEPEGEPATGGSGSVRPVPRAPKPEPASQRARVTGGPAADGSSPSPSSQGGGGQPASAGPRRTGGRATGAAGGPGPGKAGARGREPRATDAPEPPANGGGPREPAAPRKPAGARPAPGGGQAPPPRDAAPPPGGDGDERARTDRAIARAGRSARRRAAAENAWRTAPPRAEAGGPPPGAGPARSGPGELSSRAPDADDGRDGPRRDRFATAKDAAGRGTGTPTGEEARRGAAAASPRETDEPTGAGSQRGTPAAKPGGGAPRATPGRGAAWGEPPPRRRADDDADPSAGDRRAGAERRARIGGPPAGAERRQPGDRRGPDDRGERRPFGSSDPSEQAADTNERRGAAAAVRDDVSARPRGGQRDASSGGRAGVGPAGASSGRGVEPRSDAPGAAARAATSRGRAGGGGSRPPGGRRPPAGPGGRPAGSRGAGAPRQPLDPAVYRRRRLIPLGMGLILLIVLIMAVALLHGGGPDKRVARAESFVAAWSRGDYPGMYDALTPDAQAQVSLTRFVALYKRAASTATTVKLLPTGPGRLGTGRVVRVPVSVTTKTFGTYNGFITLPLEGKDSPKVAWRANLVFPGLREGETLNANLELPPRATILARDGEVLASGQTRTPGPGMTDVSVQTVGEVGQIPPERKQELAADGIPAGAQVGLTGLERALDDQLRGTPGGTLRAGTRNLAGSQPKQAPAVKTTLSPSVVRAATAALTGQTGGIVALDPRTGAVLGFSGIAFSGLQPPGSTFKIITLTAALEAGITTPQTEYPVETSTTLEGVELDNANQESCGGTLAKSFALSCNSVFAPLGAQLGADKLVATAEKFGFNGPPLLPGAAQASLPEAADVGDDLAVGSTAIGQGKVQATALEMASVAGTIADDGHRPQLTLLQSVARRQNRLDGPKATSPAVAKTVRELMQGVVTGGTGVKAAIPGIQVAGKTGTAELQDTKKCDVDPSDPTATEDPESCSSGGDESDTDAWFSAFAPAGGKIPRVAVGVLVVKAGAGGDTAAPIARQVLLAALKRDDSGPTGQSGATG